MEGGTLGLDQKAVHHSCGKIKRGSSISLVLDPPSILGISTHLHIVGVGWGVVCAAGSDVLRVDESTTEDCGELRKACGNQRIPSLHFLHTRANG